MLETEEKNIVNIS